MSNHDALLAILLAPHAPAIETPKPAPFIRRYFYRCLDCLTVAATLEKIADSKDQWGYSNGEPNALCDACASREKWGSK